jgi:hypothetical protein
MHTQINESVSVDLLSNHITGKVYPWSMQWNGRRYTITKVGLHSMTRDGRTLIHIFSVTDGTSCFTLHFNTETLKWRLMEINE